MQSANREPIQNHFQPEGGIIRFWSSTTGKEVFYFNYPGVKGAEALVQISADGKRAATAGDGDLVRFWDTHTEKPVWDGTSWIAAGKELGQFHGQVSVNGLAFSPDGNLLAVSGRDGTVLIVDVRKVLSKP